MGGSNKFLLNVHTLKYVCYTDILTDRTLEISKKPVF